jgi:hypothetical protein
MKGNIYTRDKCAICQGKLRHDENRNSFFCKDHPDIPVIPRKVEVVFVDKNERVSKRFSNYQEAQQFLTGLRFKTIEGSFDARDYKQENPLGFETQFLKWLEIKRQSVKPGSFDNLMGYSKYMINYWGQRNIKTFSYGDFEDYLFSLKVGEKTRSNHRSCIHDFFMWLAKREDIQMPQIPKINYELGWRNIVDIETQQAIINKVKEISHDINPKIWIGIQWLATYVSIRPFELRELQEKHINVNGYFVIPHPKEKKPKIIPMLPEDIELYKSFPIGMPDLYFFRHDGATGTAKPGARFGKNFLYKYWIKACKALRIAGVDMYGGTRHSKTTALGDYFSKEELREHGTLHSTNKAFDRYLQTESKASIKIYEKAREIGKKQVLDFEKKSKGES